MGVEPSDAGNIPSPDRGSEREILPSQVDEAIGKHFERFRPDEAGITPVDVDNWRERYSGQAQLPHQGVIIEPVTPEPEVSNEERAEIEANRYLEDLARQIEQYQQETNGLFGLDGFLRKSPALRGRMTPTQREARLIQETDDLLRVKLPEAITTTNRGPDDPTVIRIFSFLNNPQRTVAIEKIQEIKGIATGGQNG